MVRIRLRRMGLRHRPTYRIVVIDSRKARDGKYIESIGNYNPRSKDLWVNLERADYWLSVGAQPSGTALSLIRRRRKEAPTPAVTPEPVSAPIEPVSPPAHDQTPEATPTASADETSNLEKE